MNTQMMADLQARLAGIEGMLANLATQNGRFMPLEDVRPKPQSMGVGSRAAFSGVNVTTVELDRKAKRQDRKRERAELDAQVVKRVKAHTKPVAEAPKVHPKANLAGAFQDDSGRWHERGGRFMKPSRLARLGLTDGGQAKAQPKAAKAVASKAQKPSGNKGLRTDKLGRWWFGSRMVKGAKAAMGADQVTALLAKAVA